LASLFSATLLAGEQSPAGMFQDLADAPGVGDFFGGSGGADELTLTGTFKVHRGQSAGVISIRASLAPHWHVYAIDQQGGPGPAKITVPASAPVRVTGPFQPDEPPEIRTVEVFDVPLREHYDQVTWSAPIELAAKADVESLALEVVFSGQICSDEVGCKPIFGEKIKVAFGGFLDAVPDGAAGPAMPVDASVAAPAPSIPSSDGGTSAAEAGTTSAAASPSLTDLPVFRADRAQVSFRGYVEPATAATGGTFTLRVSAAPDSGWHLYAYEPQDPEQVAKPTLIALDTPAAWRLDGVAASQPPIVKPGEGDDPAVSYHEGDVTWTARITVSASTPPGDYVLAGIVGYQTCTDTSCDRPLGARFTANVKVGEAAGGGYAALAFTPARYAEAAQLAAVRAAGLPAADVPSAVASEAGPEATAIAPDSGSPTLDAANGQTPLGLVLVYAFLGGLVLNIMPCVLPVIGLKVMAFVQQAGESRAKVLALNIWYSLGLMSVFLLLATLATVWNVGWGQQFSSETVTITLAAIVFAMGLSFLGVWQMPIPGFVGSGSAVELAEKEGPAGAFMKGILTTILATPCSGPGVAVALGYCTGKPASVVYMIFAMVGLGMASPYLVIGMFPKALRLLPKPGAWMERFEQIMGLVLLATVIYLLSFTAWANVLPAVTLMLGLGAACWWIGQIPFTAGFLVKARGWLGGVAFATLCGLFAFTGQTTIGDTEVYGLRGVMEHRLERYVARQAALHGPSADLLNSPEITQHTSAIRWVPFSEERLATLTAANRTVLVDFTADWCLTCKTLEATVLDTQEVRDVLRANGVVALQADWTDGDPVISRRLESLGGKQVPVIAIFPAGRAQQPIVLSGFYTKAVLLEKLRDAGASVAARNGRGDNVSR
jgi:thiol:disulfide interchange protein